MICYKIVRRCSGKLLSLVYRTLIATGNMKYITEYIPGDETFPPVEGSKLFAHSDLRGALIGLELETDSEQCEVWECEALGEIDTACSKATVFANMDSMWSGEFNPETDDYLLLRETVILVDGLKLVKRVK